MRIRRRTISLLCAAGTAACLAVVLVDHPGRLAPPPAGYVRTLSIRPLSGREDDFRGFVQEFPSLFAKVYVHGPLGAYTLAADVADGIGAGGELTIDLRHDVWLADVHSVQLWGRRDRGFERERAADMKEMRGTASADGILLHFELR